MELNISYKNFERVESEELVHTPQVWSHLEETQTT